MNANASGMPPRLAATPLNAVTSDRSHFGRRSGGGRIGEQRADHDAEQRRTRRQLDREPERVAVLSGERVAEGRRTPKLPSRVDQRLGEHADRRERSGTGRGTRRTARRPSQAQFAALADARGPRRSARPPRRRAAIGHEPLRRRRPSGPSSRPSTVLAAAIWAGREELDLARSARRAAGSPSAPR